MPYTDFMLQVRLLVLRRVADDSMALPDLQARHYQRRSISAD